MNDPKYRIGDRVTFNYKQPRIEYDDVPTTGYIDAIRIDQWGMKYIIRHNLQEGDRMIPNQKAHVNPSDILEEKK
jgi:hypothetical protein